VVVLWMRASVEKTLRCGWFSLLYVYESETNGALTASTEVCKAAYNKVAYTACRQRRTKTRRQKDGIYIMQKKLS